jgi:uncharacterized protein YkuJ
MPNIQGKATGLDYRRKQRDNFKNRRTPGIIPGKTNKRRVERYEKRRSKHLQKTMPKSSIQDTKILSNRTIVVFVMFSAMASLAVAQADNQSGNSRIDTSVSRDLRDASYSCHKYFEAIRYCDGLTNQEDLVTGQFKEFKTKSKTFIKEIIMYTKVAYNNTREISTQAINATKKQSEFLGDHIKTVAVESIKFANKRTAQSQQKVYHSAEKIHTDLEATHNKTEQVIQKTKDISEKHKNTFNKTEQNILDVFHEANDTFLTQIKEDKDDYQQDIRDSGESLINETQSITHETFNGTATNIKDKKTNANQTINKFKAIKEENKNVDLPQTIDYFSDFIQNHTFIIWAKSIKDKIRNELTSEEGPIDWIQPTLLLFTILHAIITCIQKMNILNYESQLEKSTKQLQDIEKYNKQLSDVLEIDSITDCNTSNNNDISHDDLASLVLEAEKTYENLKARNILSDTEGVSNSVS